MPSIAKVLDNATTVFALAKGNAKIQPDFIMVNNVIPAQNAVIELQDRFTPSVSNGVAIPVVETRARLNINVSTAACVSIRDELKNIQILGQMELTIATPDADCIATIGYSYI